MPAPAGVRVAPGRPRRHRGVEPRAACSHSGAIPKPSARGPRMPWPVPSRATRRRPARFAISSACWRRPWMHRNCSRLKDLEKSSHAVRDLTAKLRRHRGFATSNLVAICELERQLAEDFRRRGNFAESRALLMDSLDLLEGRRVGRRRPGCRRGVRTGPDGARVGRPPTGALRRGDGLIPACRGDAGELAGPRPATHRRHHLD